MKTKNYILLLIATIFISISAIAQVEFKASVNKNTVAVGERFQISFTINSSGGDFSPPEFYQDFKVLSGPNQSSSMQFINGQMSSSKTISYILTPRKTGKFTIGSAKITSNGKTYKTAPITITATKGSPQNSTNNSSANNKSEQYNLDKNLFIKLHINKNEAYLGEQIRATYKLYNRLKIVDNGEPEIPNFDGFWVQEIEDKDNNYQQQREIINGVEYTTFTLKQAILFPQRTGEIDLPGMSIPLTVRVSDNNRKPRTIFEQFMGSYKDVKINLESNAQKIKVKPLPSGQPNSFAGAVGNFNISSSINKTELKANEALTLKITISGSGNLKLIEAPKLEFPADFEVYDPKVIDKISVTPSGVSGKKTFEYLLIPRHGGEFDIPSFEFSFFDTKTKTYKTKKTDNYHIFVEKGENDSETAYFSSQNKEDVKILGKDIRYIHNQETTFTSKNNYFLGSGLFWLILLIPLLAVATTVFATKKYNEYSSDTIKIRGKKANKIAKKRLTIAKELINKEDKKFYEEIFKALYGYLGDKLNIDTSELSKEIITEKLKSRNVTEQTLQALEETLELCEMARFAPISNISKQETYDKSVKIISKIESEIA